MRILGIDPGGTGAAALLDRTGLTVEVADMPVFKVKRGRGAKNELDVLAFAHMLREWEPTVCYMEQVHGVDGDSASSAFNFGRIAGAAEAVARILSDRFEFVTPPVWKKEMGLIRTAKDDARALATSMWPASAERFRRKMDDGRAEAALIAEFGRRQLMQRGVFS